MADRQQQQRQRQRQHYDYNGINVTECTRTRQPTHSDVLDPPYNAPRMSQPPMNLARDDSGDDMSIGGDSNSRSTIDSVLSFDSMRDVHEFIREVNGRRYNTQNTTYFLPAGQSEFECLVLQPCVSNPLTPSSPFADQTEYSRLCVSNPGCLSSIPHVIPRSVTSNIFAIAFALTSCTRTPIWLTSSYDLNPVLRRRLSI